MLQSLSVPDLFLLSAYLPERRQHQKSAATAASMSMNKAWRVWSHPLLVSADSASSRAERPKGHTMNVPINSVTVIISQFIHPSDHHIVQLKFPQFSFVNHTLLKLEKKFIKIKKTSQFEQHCSSSYVVNGWALWDCASPLVAKQFSRYSLKVCHCPLLCVLGTTTTKC